MLIYSAEGVFMTENKSNSEAQKLLLEYRPTVWRKSALENALGTECDAFISCKNQLDFAQELIEILQGHKDEKLYWVLYFTYMTDKQPSDISEILSALSKKCGSIHRSSYFRLRARAIAILDSYLSKMASG